MSDCECGVECVVRCVTFLGARESGALIGGNPNLPDNPRYYNFTILPQRRKLSENCHEDKEAPGVFPRPERFGPSGLDEFSSVRGTFKIISFVLFKIYKSRDWVFSWD